VSKFALAAEEATRKAAAKRADPWRRLLLRLCREFHVASPRLLLGQLSSREVSEWDAYFRWLDEDEGPAAPRARAAPPGDDAEVSWQRLLSFADRVNTNREGS
jgi:hypothetical protein